MANFRHEHGFTITDKMLEGRAEVEMGEGEGEGKLRGLFSHSVYIPWLRYREGRSQGIFGALA